MKWLSNSRQPLVPKHWTSCPCSTGSSQRALTGDPGRLRQVLTNLVGNAGKFTERGAVIVRVAVHEGPPDALVARFEVEDTGPGIAREDQERLFVPLSQIDRSLARMHGGSGLGLAISKRLVELMGGEIGVESESGKGSTFWFTARFLLGARDTAPALDIHARIRGLRVLMLESNPAVRAGLREILAAWGMRVEDADDQGGGLALLRASAADGDLFDLTVVDTQLGVHGSLVRGIRSDVALSRTRVVLLVPFDGADPGVLGRAPWADPVLQKPVRASRLLDILVQVFGPTAERPAPPALTSPEALAPAGERHALSTPGPLILVAEDSPINQQVASGMLENLGYRCEVAGSGTEAVAAAARNRYAAILMDSQMPGLDGFGATGEIRSLEGEAHHTPIIAMTARAMPEDRARCLAAGMDDYVPKPVRAEDLAEALARWVPWGDSGAAASTSADPASGEALDAPATADVVDLGVIDALRGQRLPGRPDPVAGTRYVIRERDRRESGRHPQGGR